MRQERKSYQQQMDDLLREKREEKGIDHDAKKAETPAKDHIFVSDSGIRGIISG